MLRQVSDCLRRAKMTISVEKEKMMPAKYLGYTVLESLNNGPIKNTGYNRYKRFQRLRVLSKCGEFSECPDSTVVFFRTS